MYGRKLGNRARAALDEAWERLLAAKVRNDRGEDFMTALCREMAKAPIFPGCPAIRKGASESRSATARLS